MASTSQSVRFDLSPATGAASTVGILESPNRVLADLSTRCTPQDGTAAALRKHLKEGVHDLNGEAFARFMDQFYERISAMLGSANVAENLGALKAIDELIDVPLGESASKVWKISHYMQIMFEKKRDQDGLVLASRILGHLAKSYGALAAEEVECHVRKALDCLRGDRGESRRFAAVLILKEMAENASTVFSVHMPELLMRYGLH